MLTQILFLLPYIMSLLLSGWIVWYAWSRRKRVDSAGIFAMAVLTQSVWTLGYIFELPASSLQEKIFCWLLALPGRGRRIVVRCAGFCGVACCLAQFWSIPIRFTGGCA